MFKRLFGKKKAKMNDDVVKSTIEKSDESSFTIGDNGSLTFNIPINIQGVKKEIQVNTTLEKFMKGREIAEKNANNPDSCEREPYPHQEIEQGTLENLADISQLTSCNKAIEKH